MGGKTVPYHSCDVPGCNSEWPAHTKNGNLEVIFGIHPEIYKAFEEPVILVKRNFNICPGHAEEIKRPIESTCNFLGGVVGPDLKPAFGCWITMWHWHGGLVQQVLNHQFPYDVFSLIYRSFLILLSGREQ